MSKYAPREWAPDEKPMLPGSPSTPAHPTPLRFAYLSVGILAVEALRVAHNRYANGYASYLEELDAQRNEFSAENTVLQLRASLLAAHVDLYRALGGGWTPSP